MKRPDRAILPAPLAPLRELAANLRWSWHAPTRALFQRIDPDLWIRTRSDPWRVLAQVPAPRLERLAADSDFLAAVDAAAADLRRYLSAEDTWFRTEHGNGMRVAYLSAEFGLVAGLRIYSGGLGVLAGDHLKAASDLGVPLTGIGLFYREGYFTQRMDALGRQQDVYEPADPGNLPLAEAASADGTPLRVRVPVGEREVVARAWRVDVGRVPLYLLDTDLPENDQEARSITDRLYGGDLTHRIDQELVLGIGAVRLLEALGLNDDVVLHLNEGHAAFAALEKARAQLADGALTSTRGHTAFAEALVRAARTNVFTTHTPVEAGHDYFPASLLESRLGPYLWGAGIPLVDVLAAGRRDPANADERFCMTILAMHGAARRNAVSELHGVVSRRMWADLWPDREESQVPIRAITNGVHVETWVAPPIARLYERHVGDGWASAVDSFHWRRVDDIPDLDLWSAREKQRAQLIDVVRRRLFQGRGRTRPIVGDDLDASALTIVFARRFATYKRATLLLSQRERLSALLNGPRPVQFVFAGKAHPADQYGQALLRDIVIASEQPDLAGRFIFLEEYDVELASALVQGADVWLNVPLRPREASGTSGMKAAANGALNLSISDGWWAEAWTDHNRLPDPIGWVIEPADVPDADRDRADADAVFELLEREVVPLFHDRDETGRPAAWLRRVRAAMRQIPPFFSTHRMVRDYVVESYLPASRPVTLDSVADAR